MKTPETNDPLDGLFQENDPHIEDGGFTARVIMALPKRRRREWVRPAILLSTAMLGFVLLFEWLPALKGILAAAPGGGILLEWSDHALLMLAVLVMAAAAVIWGMFSAVRWED